MHVSRDPYSQDAFYERMLEKYKQLVKTVLTDEFAYRMNKVNYVSGLQQIGWMLFQGNNYETIWM